VEKVLPHQGVASLVQSFDGCETPPCINSQEYGDT
jgi:hypothetical protein